MIVARSHAATQKDTAFFCDVHPQLVELCNSCLYPDCTYRDGCPEYRALRSSISEGNAVEIPEGWRPGQPTSQEVTHEV